MARIVIVGASFAGLRTAESLRTNGFTGELVLVGDEPHEPHDRLPLSKTALSGWLPTDRLLPPVTRNLDARWLLGATATALDLSAREVRLADGHALEFDGLVIAPDRGRWAGEAALRGVHLLRGRDDTDRLAARPRRVLVIGGGFTGSEVASSCHDFGLAVTVTHRGAAPMASALTGAGQRDRAQADRWRAAPHPPWLSLESCSVVRAAVELSTQPAAALRRVPAGRGPMSERSPIRLVSAVVRNRFEMSTTGRSDH